MVFSKRVTEAIAKTGAAARAMGTGPRRLPLQSGIHEVDLLDQNVYLGAHLLASATAERERLLVDAQQARAVAESQNRAKDEFLAMLGHELRNPMAPITSAAHLIRMPNVRPEQVRQASDIISRQVDHMNHLVNDLLDVSRVTRGLIVLERRPVAVEAVLAAAREQTSAAIAAAGHQLDTQIGSDSYWIRGDATRLIQVLTNLVVNAAKYSPPRSAIRIAVDRDGDRIRIVVSDNGNGIEPDLLPRIFELFSQGTRTSDRSTGGLAWAWRSSRNSSSCTAAASARTARDPAREAASPSSCPRPICAPATAASRWRTLAEAAPYQLNNMHGLLSYTQPSWPPILKYCPVAQHSPSMHHAQELSHVTR
jgi:signal transduction histidine kinase